MLVQEFIQCHVSLILDKVLLSKGRQASVASNAGLRHVRQSDTRCSESHVEGNDVYTQVHIIVGIVSASYRHKFY